LFFNSKNIVLQQIAYIAPGESVRWSVAQRQIGEIA